ncbi:hypothetical protein [Mycobacterium sp. OAE908]|uniref:hypothetical protein n=1 Tax=Mycobacterium sp. OAE908 TaxID=2817899 RepID=UPI001AE88648
MDWGSRRAAFLVAIAMALVFCAGCESSQPAPNNTSSAQASPSSSTATSTQAPAAPAACNAGTRGAPDVEDVYSGQLPSYFGIREICAGDVGPGLAGADGVAGLSDLTAAEITDTYQSPDEVVLKALVGKAESGNGGAFADAFLSRVGETRNDTVTLDGHTVRYFNAPGAEGYAYAEGPTVVIGFITPTPPGFDRAGNQEIGKELFTRVMAAATGRPIPANSNDRARSGIEGYSPGRGRYTTPDDPGWIFFKTESIKGGPSHFCGMGPGGTVAGCDLVPGKDVPAGMNQTVVETGAPARYVHSDTPTFTRDVDALLEGHRLDNGQASCGRGYQGTIQCVIGAHSFVVSSDYGVLE